MAAPNNQQIDVSKAVNNSTPVLKLQRISKRISIGNQSIPGIDSKPSPSPTKDALNINPKTNELRKANSKIKHSKIMNIIIGLLVGGCALGLTAVLIALAVILSTITRVPTGTILLYSGNASHLLENDHQWLFCNGSEVSRSAYRRLFLIIGTTYGVGNGIDTFNLPDFRYRFPLGSSNFVNDTLSSGGTEYHNLTVAELPPHDHNQGSLVTVADGVHSHTYNDPGHNHGGSTGSTAYGPSGGGSWIAAGGSVYLGNSHSHTIPNGPTNIVIQNSGSHTHTITGLTGLTGQNRPISKMPPYQTVHYIIRI